MSNSLNIKMHLIIIFKWNEIYVPINNLFSLKIFNLRIHFLYLKQNCVSYNQYMLLERLIVLWRLKQIKILKLSCDM